MQTICLHDKSAIEPLLRRNTFLNIYALGDLDDLHWPHTTWYALPDGDEIRAVALMYTRLSVPTLVALGDEKDLPHLKELVRSLLPLLPRRFYCHLSPGLSDILREHYAIDSRGEHYKMGLTHPAGLESIDTSEVIRLSVDDAEPLQAFYAESFPENSFEPSMLEAGPGAAIRGSDGLVSAAVMHVYSARYGVAAVGTTATHPAQRGQGQARAVIAALCKDMLGQVDHIGLNVKADNQPALRCYKSLGFERIASYEECLAELA